MKIKTMGIKCDECGKYFLPGNKPDGRPNGVGFKKADGSVHNVCAECVDKIGDKLMPTTEVDRLMAFIRAYDRKIRELMTLEEYKKFSEETAKQVLLAEIMASPDENFKKIMMENMGKIMGEDKNEP